MGACCSKKAEPRNPPVQTRHRAPPPASNQHLPTPTDTQKQTDPLPTKKASATLSIPLLDPKQKNAALKLLSEIETEPSRADAYVELANLLPPGKCVTLLNGNTLSTIDLYKEAIHRNTKLGVAYYRLGVQEVAGTLCTLLDGRKISERDLYAQALTHDPSIADAYLRLGVRLQHGETITISDRCFTEKDLYLACISLEPKISEAYFNLASLLGDEMASVTLIDGRVLSSRELLVEAINADPHSWEAYCNVACDIVGAECVTLRDGRTMTQRELLQEAIEVMDKEKVWGLVEFSTVFGNLATLIPKWETIFVRGEAMTAKDLWLASLRCDGTSAFSFFHLGKLLGRGETAKLPDGRTITKCEAFAMAIHHDHTMLMAYHALADELSPGQCINLMNGKSFTTEELREMNADTIRVGDSF